MNINFRNDIRELKQGYTEKNHIYRCLFCEQEYLGGDIYSFGARLVEARTAIKLHIRDQHNSVFDMFINEDKKTIGLTDVQRELLSCFYHGISDKEIAVRTSTSPSTVRYQRFNLREKARQAKVFLTLFELMEEKTRDEPKPQIHAWATMVDERYMTTEEESRNIIEAFFSSANPLVLKTFSPKEKKKLVILRAISEQFEKGRRYSEKEVNSILKPIYEDYVTIRRYLIEYGFMDRTQNCEEYWLK